jgi:hypothetical protein
MSKIKERETVHGKIVSSSREGSGRLRRKLGLRGKHGSRRWSRNRSGGS